MSIYGNPVMLGGSGGGGGGLRGDMPPTSDIGSDGDIYTQVYTDSTLTGDGASYIDTGIYPTSRNAIELEFALAEVTSDTTAYPYVFGCRASSNNFFFIRFYPVTSTSASQCLNAIKGNSPTAGASDFYESSLKQSDFLNLFHKVCFGFSLSGMNLYYSEDGIQKKDYGTSGNTNSFDYPCYLLAVNDQNIATGASKTILRHCKIWDKDQILIGYFIPYLDGNTPCALNLVTGTKHYNLGTGDFTYTATGTVKVGLVWLKENGTWSIIGHS